MINLNKMLNSIVKRPNALIAFAIYSFLLTFVSYQLGKTPSEATPLEQIRIPFLLGLFSIGVSFLNHYIDSQVKEEFSKKNGNTNQKNYTENIIYKQKLDFVSVVQNKIPIENISIQELLNEDDTPKDLNKKLKTNFENFQISHETVSNLIFTYENDEMSKNVEILKIIVAIAVNDKLLNKYHPEFNQKCNCIYGYLRAWLVCSIKYETDKLPIEWIKQTTVKREELIKVIGYIKKLVIHDERVKETIPNNNCRELIAKYLDKLSKKVENIEIRNYS